MKLFNSMGPNPHVVRIFLKEKGIDIPFEEIDLMGGQNRSEEFKQVNPSGQLPALELDDGSTISEITAICEYLDETQPGTTLIGATPQERAITRMWVRKIDLAILENLANGFRFAEGLEIFKERIRTIPHAADDLKAIAQEKLAWLDGQIAGKKWICGDRLTLADILLFAFLSFGSQVGQPLDPELKNIGTWYDRMSARDSASA